MLSPGFSGSFDMYRKIPADLLSSSSISSSLSTLTLVLLPLLFMIETFFFFSPSFTSVTHLDLSSENIRINFNVTMHALDCHFAVVELRDVLGTETHNVSRYIEKWSITDRGERVKFEGSDGRHAKAKVVLHDHDEEGNSKHGTHEELLEDGEHVKVISDAIELEAALDPSKEGKEFVFIDFFAPWCSWCQRLDPTWEKFAEEIHHLGNGDRTKEQFSRFQVAKIDCTTNQHVCGEQGIKAFPTLRLFYNGEKWGGDYKGDRTLEGFRSHLNQAYLDKVDGDSKGLQFRGGAKYLKRMSELNGDWHAADHAACEISGYLKVNRVPGTFFIEAASEFQDIIPSMQNVSHTVNELSFGKPLAKYKKRRLSSAPEEYRTTKTLDGQTFVTEELHSSHHHNLDVIHARYVKKKTYFFGLVDLSDDINFYQYLTQSQLIMQSEEEVPEARFTYDVSPMMTTMTRSSLPWFEYLCNLSAVIGGTFSLIQFVSKQAKVKRF